MKKREYIGWLFGLTVCAALLMPIHDANADMTDQEASFVRAIVAQNIRLTQENDRLMRVIERHVATTHCASGRR